MLMPLGFQHGILMLEEKINFRDECPIEYLQRNYGEVVQVGYTVLLVLFFNFVRSIRNAILPPFST